MKVITKKHYIISFILFLSISACQKQKDDEKTTAPKLPPQSSMNIPFNDFAKKNKSAASSQLYWGTASTIVGIWNLIIGVGLAVPVTAFNAAFYCQPKQVNNNLWRWSYNTSVGLNTYTSELEASLINEGINWEMYISKFGSDTIKRFKWYSGLSKTDGTGGYWLLNESPQNPNPYVKVSWAVSADSTSEVKFEIVKESSNNKGNYIQFGSEPNNFFDKYYNLYARNDSSLININWNKANKEGRIKSNKGILGNYIWCCWDKSLNDITCTPEK